MFCSYNGTRFSLCIFAVFLLSDVSIGCDSNIPLVAQELMKKMIHQFAFEYASKCLPNTNGVTTRTSSPLSETSDAPLDLTVSRPQEEKEEKEETDRESGTDAVKDSTSRGCRLIIVFAP